MLQTTDDAPAPAGEDDVLFIFLAGRDVACPLCRYNLRGLASPRCPECGRELCLTIGLVEPRIGAWITCTVACAASAGLGILASVSVLRAGWDFFAA
jgi:hypothetical protein